MKKIFSYGLRIERLRVEASYLQKQKDYTLKHDLRSTYLGNYAIWFSGFSDYLSINIVLHVQCTIYEYCYSYSSTKFLRIFLYTKK